MRLYSNVPCPDDIASLKIILENVQQMKADQYSIIISLDEKSSEKNVLTGNLFPATLWVRTTSTFYIPLNSNKIGEKKDWGYLQPGIINFINNAPAINVLPSIRIMSETWRYKTPVIQSNLLHLLTVLQKTIILIGNPGAGKSTLLTSMVDGQIRFHSGISIGKGLTSTLQEVYYKSTYYIDTPGLSDISLRTKAAEAIQVALAKGGKFKV